MSDESNRLSEKFKVAASTSNQIESSPKIKDPRIQSAIDNNSASFELLYEVFNDAREDPGKNPSSTRICGF